MDEEEDYDYTQIKRSFGLVAQIILKQAVEAVNNKEDGEIFENCTTKRNNINT